MEESVDYFEKTKEFANYFEKVKESVYNKQRLEYNKKQFLEDIKICNDYLEIIKKLDTNNFFPKDFIDFLRLNLYGLNNTKYSIILLNTKEGNESWYYMSPEIQQEFIINFKLSKSWIDQLQEDNML